MEITRIVNSAPEEAFSQFIDVRQTYRLLSALVGPDKQSDAVWKERAKVAQQSKSHGTILKE